MAHDENKALIRRLFEHALSTSNLVLADNLLAPDFVYHGVAGATATDRETWKTHAATIFTSFPDLQARVDDVLAEGDMVLARCTLTGTHLGDFLGIPASGDRMSVWGIWWFVIGNGEIVEEWPGLDASGLMRRLGTDTYSQRGASLMTVEDSKTIMHCFLEALSRRDPAAAAGLLAPDVVAHVPGLPGAVQGRDAWARLFEMYIAAFPDMQITVHEEMGEGDTAMGRWTWNGSHQGPLMEIPATGRTVSGISGMGVYRVREGYITEEWVMEDTLGLMQQLGVIPNQG